MMRKAFTLIEVTVAVALLVVVMAMAGTIFRVGIESHRLALANAEIMRKFRTITDQLDADLKGLCKDGEIFIVWDANDGRSTGRDGIMFFSRGDFYSYGTYDNGAIRSNTARVAYKLALPEGVDPNQAVPAQRIMTRTQHLLTWDDLLLSDPLTVADTNDTSVAVTDEYWQSWCKEGEYFNRRRLKQWMEQPERTKYMALSATLDLNGDWTTVNSNDTQMILCEAVGAFRIQGWYGLERRWVPDDDPDNDPSTAYSDLKDPNDDEKDYSVLYSTSDLADVRLGGRFADSDFRPLMDEENFGKEESFNRIPGLGRALKFTFTLYDSRGLIPGGRTFTHIVYLDR